MATPQVVEQKFFLRWVNFMLFPNFQILDLGDLMDGYLLLRLTELFLGTEEADSRAKPYFEKEMSKTTTSATLGRTTQSRQARREEAQQRKTEWATANIAAVFENCEKLKVDSLSTIPLEDILEGKKAAISNLLYLIAYAIHLKEMHIQGVTGEIAVLQWVREISMGLVPNGVKSFGSFQDGTALCLLSVFPEKDPDEIFIKKINKFTSIERCTFAIRQLTDKGIPAVCDPPDLSMGLLPARCIKIYIGMVYAVYNKYSLKLLPSIKEQRDHEIRKEERKKELREKRNKEKEQQRNKKQEEIRKRIAAQGAAAQQQAQQQQQVQQQPVQPIQSSSNSNSDPTVTPFTTHT
ncbi:MAG: hypothetical protein EZS28_035203 [Streblomastix strix]|uniref:Calponin-homology (CH) domain-containing protein n=1 Tax=Streblomastix strix TaxID=222440 RepID=A0A5J4UGS8_9EUKA|nr:MAG: hypothetical protein EZS28_035203 [Streblomastix strix]